jgi:hypothetical protein
VIDVRDNREVANVFVVHGKAGNSEQGAANLESAAACIGIPGSLRERSSPEASVYIGTAAVGTIQ